MSLKQEPHLTGVGQQIQTWRKIWEADRQMDMSA